MMIPIATELTAQQKDTHENTQEQTAQIVESLQGLLSRVRWKGRGAGHIWLT